ncbi:hypothetical protein [Sphingomonas sp. MA1305]|uniref:hypothetical protein n=1 Tax=Sphingomonas sp. MA1305 TaxID=2479204 RepID=UPI0018E00458|nr:hypothetical protein [Sphingomonas sp. MA1305]
MPTQPIMIEARRLRQEALDVISTVLMSLGEGQDRFLSRLPKLRLEMNSIVTVYQAFKHRHIFEPLSQFEDAVDRSAANDLKIASISASESYRAHMQAWPRSRVEDDWRGYCAAVRLIGGSLHRAIVLEGDLVEELLSRQHGVDTVERDEESHSGKP